MAGNDTFRTHRKASNFTKDRVYIGGTPVPKQIAKERMFMLNDYHFLQVKESISKVTHPIRNTKNYIFTSLFNIVTTGDDALINEIQTAEQDYKEQPRC